MNTRAYSILRRPASAILAGSIVAILATTSSVHAATRTWNGGDVDDDFWTSADNWGGTVPVALDDLVFGGTVRLTPNNDFAAATQFGTGQAETFTFNATAGAFTLSGNSVTMGASIVNNSANLQTINLGLILNGGTNARTFTANGGADITVNGVIGESVATSNLTKTGAGTLSLAGANTYTGITTVNAGTVKLDFNGATAPATNILPTTNALTLGGGTFNVTGKTGAAAATVQTLGPLVLAARTSSGFRVTQNGSLGVSVAVGAITRNAGTTADFTLPTAGTISTTTTTSTGTNSVNGNGVAYSTVDATTWLTNLTGNLGALSAFQNDAFAASLDTDILTDQSPAAFTVNTLRFNTAAKTLTLNTSGVSQVTSGGILVTSAGAGSVIAGAAGASLQAGATGKELFVHNYGTLTISAVIANNATASALTIVGPGTTTLSGTNTYTGITTLNAGSTLILGSSAALGTNVGNGARIILTSSTLQASADLSGANKLNKSLDINGSGVTIAGSNNIDFGGVFTLLTGAPRTITNNLTGGAVFTLSGATVNLSSNNNGRELIIAGTGATTISGSITDGGTGTGLLTVNNTATTTLSGANTYKGATTVNTVGGTVIFGGSNNSTGVTTFTAGTAQLNSATNGGLASGIISMANGSILSPINAARALTNAVNVTGAVATISGSQNLTLNGLVSGSGNGSRTLTNNLGVGSSLTLANVQLHDTTGTTARTLTLGGTGNTIINGVVSNGPGPSIHTFSVTNSGTTILNGAATYTGPTSVTNGTLEIAGALAGSIAPTSAVTIGAAGTVLASGNADQTLGSAATSLTLSGGTLRFSGTSTSVTDSLGQFALTANSTLDFGANFGNQITFTLGFAAHVPLSSGLAIQNWTGTPNTAGGLTEDRLIFTGDPLAFGTAFDQNDISFNAVPGYLAIDLGGGQFEVVAVPEPTSGMLLGTAGLLAFAGARRRQLA